MKIIQISRVIRQIATKFMHKNRTNKFLQVFSKV